MKAAHTPAFPRNESLISVGLEIGTTKICAAVGEVIPDGTLSIRGIASAPSLGVRRGEIVDFETVQKCVRKVIADAEKICDVRIKSVNLAITGSHIQSFNTRGTVNISGHPRQIEKSDYAGVQAKANLVRIPAHDVIIHAIPQHYYLDGRESISNPVGLVGKRVEVDFHIIHGNRDKTQVFIRCVNELDIKVENAVFNPYADAQAVLNQRQKDLGALVIDMGGGTTDYIAYGNGVVKQSGVIAVGGNHIHNDLCIGFRVPFKLAEKLKIEEGTVLLGKTTTDKMIILQKEPGFPGREIKRETLIVVIRERVKGILTELKSRIVAEQNLDLLKAGIILTGGTSMLNGISQLVEEIFKIPVQLTDNPQNSTAIGLLHFGQM